MNLADALDEGFTDDINVNFDAEFGEHCSGNFNEDFGHNFGSWK
jgi:hypothetical protein